MTPEPNESAPGYIVVVGGANMDVIGVPDDGFTMRDSNPGRIRVSAGGVGRNIAENLARLGEHVELVTGFGGDAGGGELAGACVAVGIEISGAFVAEELPAASYLAIHDDRGDLVAAVSDMRVIEFLTPTVLSEPTRLALLRGAALVVIDGNVPAETIEWLGETLAVPLVFEPVSTAKAVRASGVLGKLAAVTPNRIEAGALLGREVTDLDDAEVAASELVALGVGAAFVTCGDEGIAFADADGSGTLDASSVRVVNTNGAGDAFAAGVAWSLARGGTALTAAMAGTMMATAALGSEHTVNPSPPKLG